MTSAIARGRRRANAEPDEGRSRCSARSAPRAGAMRVVLPSLDPRSPWPLRASVRASPSTARVGVSNTRDHGVASCPSSVELLAALQSRRCCCSSGTAEADPHARGSAAQPVGHSGRPGREARTPPLPPRSLHRACHPLRTYACPRHHLGLVACVEDPAGACHSPSTSVVQRGPIGVAQMGMPSPSSSYSTADVVGTVSSSRSRRECVKEEQLASPEIR